MNRSVVVTLAALGGFLLLGFLFFLALAWALFSPPGIPSQVVLELDLEDGLVETAPHDPFLLALERQRLRVREAVDALHRAADDDRVLALRVRSGDSPGGLAMGDELREAVLRFRESGKPTLYFAETFGELTPGHGSYHVATAFDEIVLQPTGELGLSGLAVEAPFFRNALDRLEIQPRFDSRKEYKDAADIFTREGFSETSREALTGLLVSLRANLAQGIADGRGMPPDSAVALLDRGPFSASEALATGLVDRLAYQDEAWDDLDERLGGNAEVLSLRNYHGRGGRVWNRGDRIAVVYAVGPIMRGRSGFDPLMGSAMGASTVARAIREAADDERVRAIIFRVDSPGGSYVASDLVRREIRRARDEGTPVVVSMANAAASGGYLVSSDADRIVAHPSTITGSIGVVAGKFVIGDFMESMGITWDRIEVGETSNLFSAFEDLTERDWARLQRTLDRIYDEFVDFVAVGRGMDPAAVEEVARGRVWTGTDALERGLVDALGGFGVAVAHARELAGLEPDAPVNLAVYPAERSLFQLILEEGWGVEGGPGAASATLRGLVRLLAVLGSDPPAPAPVRMPALRLPGG
jgi:protease IV